MDALRLLQLLQAHPDVSQGTTPVSQEVRASQIFMCIRIAWRADKTDCWACVPRDPDPAGVSRARDPACLASSQVTLMLPALKPPWVALMKGIHPWYCHHHPLTDEELGPTEARHRREDKRPPGCQCSREATPAGPSFLLWGSPNPFLRHSWELRVLGKEGAQISPLPQFLFNNFKRY